MSTTSPITRPTTRGSTEAAMREGRPEMDQQKKEKQLDLVWPIAEPGFYIYM